MNNFLIIASVIGLLAIVLVLKFHFAKLRLKNDEKIRNNPEKKGTKFILPNPPDDVRKILENEPLESRKPNITKRPMKVKLPYDANDIQNLSRYNKGTYRHESGRFKSLNSV